MPTKKKYDKTELDTTLDKIEDQLAKATEEPDEGMELAKSLADVAKDALEVAKGATGQRAAKKAKAVADDVLAKAKDDEDEDSKDDHPDADKDKRDLPGWLKNIVHDGKSEGEMILAYDRDETGTHGKTTNAGHESRSLGKSMYLDGTEVVDLEPYLQKQLHEQGELRKAVRSLVKLSKGLIEGILECSKSLEQMQEDLELTQRVAGTCAKSLSYLIEKQQEAPTPVIGSKYATMEKSSAAMGEKLRAEGGQVVPYNKNKGYEALKKGLMTETQHRLWKTTGTIPPGVDLTAIAN